MIRRILPLMAVVVCCSSAGSLHAQDCRTPDLDTTIQQASDWFARKLNVATCWPVGPIIRDMLCGQNRDNPAFELLISPAPSGFPYDSIVSAYAYTQPQFERLIDYRYCNVCANDCSEDSHAFDRMFERTIQLPEAGDFLLGVYEGQSSAVFVPREAGCPGARVFQLSQQRELDVPLTIIGTDGDDAVATSTQRNFLCGHELTAFVRRDSTPVVIKMGAGTDLVRWIWGGAVEVSGGPGPDLIDISNYGTAHGDDGDDLLYGEDDAELFGDDGDDVFCPRANSPRRMSGGEGDWDIGCRISRMNDNLEEERCDLCGPRG